jgi:hypothetical protein
LAETACWNADPDTDGDTPGDPRNPWSVTSIFAEGCHLHIALTAERRIARIIENQTAARFVETALTPQHSADMPLKTAAQLFMCAVNLIAIANGSFGGEKPRYVIGGNCPEAERNQKMAAAKADIAAPRSSHFSI